MRNGQVQSGVDRFEPSNPSGESDGVAIVSGGMDSITMVYYLQAVHRAQPHLLSFDYGQRHKKELEFALKCAERLGLRWSLIDLSSLTDLISNSALTSSVSSKVSPNFDDGSHELMPDIEVPDGHYAEDNMRVTVVPNRNMIMLSIAAGVAVNAGYKYVAAGMHAGDHYQYPDCRPGFLENFYTTVMSANDGFISDNFELLTPFATKSKNDIAQLAFSLGVPLWQTWSCYKGGQNHCGRCGTCVERLEAVNSVHAPSGWDTTTYDDLNFWRETVKTDSKS